MRNLGAALPCMNVVPDDSGDSPRTWKPWGMRSPIRVSRPTGRCPFVCHFESAASDLIGSSRSCERLEPKEEISPKDNN